MSYSSRDVLSYWNREDTESMYDKHLLDAEIELIRCRLAPDTKILDAGCGEGEGTLVYASVPGVIIHAVDFSETRLKKAAKRLMRCSNVRLAKKDFLTQQSLEKDYDVIISQRFLINLTGWDLQKKVLHNLMTMLKPHGKLIMLEGSKQGADSLNKLRGIFGLDPIPIKEHNLFFDDMALCEFMLQSGHELIDHDGLAAYFFLTRGLRPFFEKDLHWDCDFNRIAKSKEIHDLLEIDNRKLSRLKLWVFRKG